MSDANNEKSLKPRGSYSNDWRKIRILHLLKTHQKGLTVNKLSKPPKNPSIEKIGLILRDLLDDGLIKVADIDDDGITNYHITTKGSKRLDAVIKFRKQNPMRLKFYTALDEETKYSDEKAYGEE